MKRYDPEAQLVFENAAQHLRHAGFGWQEMGQLLGGISPARAQLLAEGAERRQPKLCKGVCWEPSKDLTIVAEPLCPYCMHARSVHDQLMAEALLRR